MEDNQAFTDAGIGAIFDFSFNRFITLSVMKVLYILGILLLALGWLGTVVTGFRQGFMSGLIGIVVGSIAAVLLLIYLRVMLELIVVIFRIGENTSKIVQMKSGQ